MNFLSSHSKTSTLLPAVLSTLLLPPSPEMATHHLAVVWILMSTLLFVYALADLCFPLNMMALNVSSPSKGSLGSLNGLALTIGSTARSIGEPLSFFLCLSLDFSGTLRRSKN